jgi:ribonuclease inhibitor
MKDVIFNTEGMARMEQIHAELARLLDFPGHYGRNLDGLYDCLSGEIALPMKIIWKDYRRTRAKLGEDAARFLAVLEDFAREEPDFKIEIA